MSPGWAIEWRILQNGNALVGVIVQEVTITWDSTDISSGKGVTMIGAKAEAIERGEDRLIFKELNWVIGDRDRVGLDRRRCGVAHGVDSRHECGRKPEVREVQDCTLTISRRAAVMRGAPGRYRFDT